MEKRLQSMSITELNAYEQIMERKDISFFEILYATFWGVISSGLFFFVMKYVFEIDIDLSIMRVIGLTPISFIWLFAFIYLIGEVTNAIVLRREKRRLLLNK